MGGGVGESVGRRNGHGIGRNEYVASGKMRFTFGNVSNAVLVVQPRTVFLLALTATVGFGVDVVLILEHLPTMAFVVFDELVLAAFDEGGNAFVGRWSFQLRTVLDHLFHVIVRVPSGLGSGAGSDIGALIVGLFTGRIFVNGRVDRSTGSTFGASFGVFVKILLLVRMLTRKRPSLQF